ncbi:Transcriptional regulator [Weissella viridescens]|uniref:LytR family transcriptional regulator n=2 Tax=Weissella viridescens TaxID=1629 RepID=A0A0R2H047_WEIVI|nr:LCP family protein [Weissella viridescens]KRN45755.1 LytR family transcriptional regulator [Weissella viridescens]MCB6840809.1 LCP family protein [Weissella viridescens]MCB6847542.1 LCP family protein [Weissella viridescens]WJI91154.1 LCP family protein [Weissella viridescens]SOB44181.1 Transcriptional regulator [Weissella viridescens]
MSDRKKRRVVRGPRYIKSAYRERNIVLAITLLIMAIGIGFGVHTLVNANRAMNQAYQPAHVKKERNGSKLLKQRKPFSILLMGTDTGEFGRNYKGRTDSLMLAVVNPQKKTTTLVSLPRDSIVAPVGYESEFPAKLNSAYEYGSAKTSIQTVQQWLNVPIDYYAIVNMRGLEQVVNELGGIQVASPLTFEFNPETAHSDPGNLYKFTKGSTHFTHTGKDDVTHSYDRMDGKAALAFSRMRYQDPQGDYGRQARQRLVIQGISKKALSNPLRLADADFISAVSQSVKTDLSSHDIEQISGNYLLAGKTIKTGHLTGQTYDTKRGSSEFISSEVKQSVTNQLRKALDLKPAETGPLYGGEVSETDLAQSGLPTP